MSEDTTRINPLKADQGVTVHETPVTDAQRAMFSKTFAPKFEPVIPEGATREEVRLAKMFPSLHQAAPKAAPVAPPTIEAIRLAKMYPTIPGIQITEAQTAALEDSDPLKDINFAAKSYAGLAGFAARNGLTPQAQRELLALHKAALAEDEP